jgi:hypothetical protein
MGIISDIREALKEIPLSDILRERLTTAEQTIEQLEKENINLKEQHRNALEKINKLEKDLMAFRSAKTEFVEERGALFKRRPEGGYHKAVFCPKCRMPMGSMEGVLPYACDKCKIVLDFTGDDLPEILRELTQ